MSTGLTLSTWLVGDQIAVSDKLSFKSFIEPGIYDDAEVELVWQYKKHDEDWWSNLSDAPNDYIVTNFETRQLLRLVAEQDSKLEISRLRECKSDLLSALQLCTNLLKEEYSDADISPTMKIAIKAIAKALEM